jgi:transposase
MRLLVFERILHPSSKKGAWEERGAYFDAFDFSLDDVYRALSHVATLKDGLMLHLNSKVAELYGRDTELVYYDVTNYYFEIDETGGLPVAYDLSFGNTLDCETLISMLSRIKGKGGFGFERIICVADKGLNTSDNIAALLAKGDGYIFANSVRGADKKTKGWALSGAGWRPYGTGEDGAFRVKERIAQRTLRVTVQAADKKRGIKKKTESVKVAERQVAFWSKKYDLRAKAERTEAVAKAQEMVAHPARLKAMLEKTAAKYLIGVTVDDVVTKRDDVLLFNEERLAAEEALDGYYIISTSEVDKAAGKTIDIYRGLWRIEETFRVTKSDLKARPVYVFCKEHIEAHFMVCFLALLIMRILQTRTGWRHSSAAIAKTLAAASATHEGANWWIFDHRDEVLENISQTTGIDFSRRLTTGKIRSLVGTTKKHGQ